MNRLYIILIVKNTGNTELYFVCGEVAINEFMESYFKQCKIEHGLNENFLNIKSMIAQKAPKINLEFSDGTYFEVLEIENIEQVQNWALFLQRN